MSHRVHTRPLFGDVDAMNVVYYGNYPRFFELGRCELMRAGGGSYARLQDEGYHLPVTEAFIRYKSPALYDDDLVVETSVAWLKKASLRFDYKILKNNDNGDETLLVHGYTSHGCVDLKGHVRPFPNWVSEVLKKFVN